MKETHIIKSGGVKDTEVLKEVKDTEVSAKDTEVATKGPSPSFQKVQRTYLESIPTMHSNGICSAFVYFMTCKFNSTLYIGVTNDIARRVTEHREGKSNGFTAKYHLYKLVYYEEYSSISRAIEREKQLKRWRRCWKDELVNKYNPLWEDLMGEG